MFGLAALGVAACLAPSERRTMSAWLLCDECEAGEYEAVLALGRRAVPALGAALRGPGADQLAHIREQLTLEHARLRTYLQRTRGSTAGLSPLQGFVSRYADHYVATYQVRAAMALRGIGTEGARAHLYQSARRDSAGVAPLRPDVRRVIDSLRLRFVR